MKSNNIDIIKKSTRDLFQLMPTIVVCKVVLSIATAVFSIFTVKLLANVIESAGMIIGNEPVNGAFIKNIVYYVLCYIGIQISDIVLYYIDNIWIVPKMEFFHHKLSLCPS